MKYYLYHIPGKKIGVTCNLISRVTEQQGYAPDEYEVLLTSEDIDYISDMEIELQKSYGYRVDRQLYKNLHCNKFNQMNVNVTTQTVTFPCPLNKLKGHLMDSLGIQWMTPEGESFKLTTDMVPWIVHNAKTSMFNDNRCYVYNKALSTAFNTGTDISGVIKEIEERIVNNKFDLIRTWAEDKGIYAKGDSKTQYLKLMEEAGELSRAILKRDRPEIIDAIGDMVVVLTNLAKLENLDIEDCIDSAYNVIKNRKGKMQNGTFVKNQTHSGTLNYTQTL
jgi:NTP pyrophosphatase (non-canonical NTP hydrolase)